MIKELLKDDFMDCRRVKEICMQEGHSKAEVKKAKSLEGIKTVNVTTSDGRQMWLWFDPDQIWEKYSEREGN
ncbi:MAG: hypothetical protein ACI4W2_03150 [Eubacterium sp.]